MKYPKLRELKEAIKALIKGPYTTKFPFAPHIPPEGYRGKPEPSDEYCIACGACAEVCPARAIEVENKMDSTPPTRSIRWRYDLCIFCGQCERYCTTEKGVHLTPEFDLAAFDRKTLVSKDINRELIICDDCKSIIGTRQQFLFLAKKLGSLVYGNYSLVLTSLQELGLVKLEQNKEKENYERSKIFHITCPKCRRINLLKDDTGKKDL